MGRQILNIFLIAPDTSSAAILELSSAPTLEPSSAPILEPSSAPMLEPSSATTLKSPSLTRSSSSKRSLLGKASALENKTATIIDHNDISNFDRNTVLKKGYNIK